MFFQHGADVGGVEEFGRETSRSNEHIMLNERDGAKAAENNSDIKIEGKHTHIRIFRDEGRGEREESHEEEEEQVEEHQARIIRL